MKRVKILGKNYRIVPSLENMVSLEEQTSTNLISGINPHQINLAFLKATIENIIEDEQGNHIDQAILAQLYQNDIKECQAIFLQCYREMYTLPPSEDRAVKKAIRRRNR